VLHLSVISLVRRIVGRAFSEMAARRTRLEQHTESPCCCCKLKGSGLERALWKYHFRSCFLKLKAPQWSIRLRFRDTRPHARLEPHMVPITESPARTQRRTIA